ncbi:MAG: hypothetical protein V7641_5455 [Blastocatellia bacterium]
MGSVYDLIGDGERALTLHAQALPLFQQSGDKRGEGAALNNLASIYWRTGELDKALEFFKQALPLPRSLKDLQAEATVLGNIGEVYRAMGEYQQAFDYYDQSLKPTRAVKDYEGEGYILDNMGSLYSSLGDFQTALLYLNQALDIRRKIGDQAGEELSLGNLGALYHRQRDFTKAITYYRQGLEIARAIPSPDGEATKLANLGRVHLDSDEPLKAIEYYQQALVLAKKIGSRPLEASILNGLGQAYAGAGETQKAFDHFNQALASSQAFKNRQLEAIIRYQLARGENKRNNLKEALAHIEAGLALVESVRTKIGSRDLRSSYFATAQDYYEFYIDLLMRLHEQRPSEGFAAAALAANERARARSLLELLTEAHADIRRGVDPQLLEQERSLQRRLNVKADGQMRLLSRAYTAEQATAAAMEIETLTAEYQAVAARIRQTSPRYIELTQTPPLRLKAIQEEIDADTLLLEYSLGNERSYLWLVSRTEIKSFELPRRAEIEATARSFYEFLNTPNSIYASAQAIRDAQQQEMLETALRLSQALLGPVAAQLGQKRLVIVADGALQYLPFAALPDPVASKRNPETLQPLIAQHELVSLPSISVLTELRKELAVRKPAPKNLAVLADPVFYADDERVKRNSTEGTANPPKAPSVKAGSLIEKVEKIAQESRARRQGEHLLRLTGTRKEAEGILALVPAVGTRKALDFEANRALASSGELSQYRYVHFATHGLLDSRHPELSAIVLSLVDENGNAQDGFLRAHEVYNLNLPADVVVLSGCQTGLGKEIRGEGLIGLTRGFMYAGAARVVVSLWSVDDEATAELMVGFYSSLLKEGKRPAEALRVAQLKLMQQARWRAPHYWAAFILQGDWN